MVAMALPSMVFQPLITPIGMSVVLGILTMMTLMTSSLGQKMLIIMLDKSTSFMAQRKTLLLPLNSQVSKVPTVKMAL